MEWRTKDIWEEGIWVRTIMLGAKDSLSRGLNFVMVNLPDRNVQLRCKLDPRRSYLSIPIRIIWGELKWLFIASPPTTTDLPCCMDS